jgi:hypothetical protein
MGRFADLLDRPSEVDYALRPNDKDDKRTTTKTTKDPFGRFGRLVVGRNSPEPFPFAAALDALEARCPDHVEPGRWHLCIEDAQRFLAAWGDKAQALGWTAGELLGLHDPPAHPHPSYYRLSRYDATGLLWHLDGNRVVALTADTAAIESRSTGNVLIYRKHNKPAYGPVGDSLDDL